MSDFSSIILITLGPVVDVPKTEVEKEPTRRYDEYKSNYGRQERS
jgi:hypothetical protein